MRIPVALAWGILGLAFFTAALLRQFHDRTPASPLAPGLVGSLLFAAIFFLLLVSAREWRRGAVAGSVGRTVRVRSGCCGMSVLIGSSVDFSATI